MADNTRVNDLQDKLLKAMDILNAQALNSISFDKTITCKIENDKDKKDGKYEVNDGNRIFTAYSGDTRLRAGDTVYVTVPEGNFENQKMIIGKKTADNDKPFNFTQPFDTFFDMTGNLAGDIEEYGLLANNIKDEHKTLVTKLEDCFTSKTILEINENTSGFPTDLINYPRLAVRADFRSWIKNAVRGNYGLSITLKTEKPNTTIGQTENGTYNYLLDSSMMYGNPYNFETYYSQEIVLDLEKQDIGRVIGIRVDFYQNANFYDKFNEPIPSSENGFLKHKNDSYQKYGDVLDDNVIGEEYIKITGQGYYKADGAKLENNLFVDNLEIYFGQDISTFNSDLVEIYTKDSLKFETPQEKNISARWVHLKDGNPIDMIKKPDIDVNYEIRWYKYILGSAAADEYCGVYWDRINPTSGKRLFYKDNKWYEKEFIEAEGVEKDKVVEDLNIKSFTCKFTPDCKKNQEKIKCIILVDNNMPYRSNEILFENRKEVVDTSVQTFVNALQIKEDDNTNGNYMIYGQNNNLLDSEDTKIVRTLSAYFDTNGDGKAESLVQPNDNLQWIFPNNSMIILQNGDPLLDNNGNEQKDENGNIIRSNIVTKNQPQYKIASYYSPGKSNNTIQCVYKNNGITYTTEKEFTFGPSGTMGTDQTIVIDFVGDTKALLVGAKTFQLQVQVYNNKNEILTDVPENITWSWLHCVKDPSDKISYLQIPNKEKDNEDKEKSHPSIIDITVRDGFNIDQLYIIQVEVGDLITYFPIPIKSDINYSYITGATQVIYQSDGEPNYSKEIYNLCEFNGAHPKIPVDSWKIKHHIPEDNSKEKQELYIGTLKSYNNGQVLEPLSIYIKDAPVYGVQALDSNGNILWTQPILVLQNKWSSNVINKWDGKSLQLDEINSAVIAAAVSAGKKNSDDNTFSGVMIGDWSGKDLDTNQAIANQTGVYGFHHGAMSYAFKEDGTAFIGKYGDGRINFDGNNSTIYSANYKNYNRGMMINLGKKDEAPYLDMKYATDKWITLGFSSNNSDATPYLHMNSSQSKTKYPLAVGSKFTVEWNGNIYANDGYFENGYFEGTLYSKEGEIGGWIINERSLSNRSGTVKLDCSGSITGATITGGNINGTKIVTEELYAGISEGYEYYIDERDNITSDWVYTGKTIVFSENYGSTVIDYLTRYRYKGKISNVETARLGSFKGAVNENLDTSVAGISITPNNIPLVLEANERIRITSKNGTVYVVGKKISFSTPTAADQEGIYARFA